MNTSNYHRAPIHVRQAKKTRRPLFRSGLIVLLLLITGGGISYFYQHSSSAPPAKTVTPKSSPLKNAQLVWPADGQAAVGTVEDGVLAYSSDHQKPQPTASMAKVITVLAIMEKQPLELGQAGPTYTMTAEDVAIYRAYAANNVSLLPVYEGMQLTQHQALQAILLPSANNIADTMAVRIFGSTQAYIAYTHDMLKRMGLSQTAVADASGFNPATVSTPTELITLGIAALKNPVIAEIVSQQHAQIPGVGMLTNTNKLLNDTGVIGIKTGTTDEAGSCLLFAGRYMTKNGKSVTIVGVIMGDTNASHIFNGSRELLASTAQALGAEVPQSVESATPPPQRQRLPAPGQETGRPGA